MSSHEPPVRRATTSRLVRENVLEIGGRFHVALDLILDRGGTSTVYAGRQISVAGRPVAVKVYDNVPKDPEERARLHARMKVEVQAAGALKNSRIVSIIDAGVIEDGPLAGLDYIVMEYVGGGSLAARLEDWAKRDELPAPREIVHVLREVGLAIEVFESNKIVHRDLKPANVLYEQDGSIKVIDLGMARIDGNAPTLTRQGIPVGTPVYMSPEQSRGESLDSRSDLWSLGAIVFHMATGRPPAGDLMDAEEDFIEALSASAYLEEPRRVDQLVPGFPPALASLIARLLAADRDDRFPNVQAFLAELACVERALGQPEAVAPAPGSATQQLIAALESSSGNSTSGAIDVSLSATDSHLRVPEQGAEEANTADGPPEPGRLFVGRYKIIREVGSGASGRVYEAYDERLDRHVAVKMLRPMPTDEERQRFLREARLAAKLPPHPHLVALFDAAFVKWGPEEQPYIVMELVRGRTLADRVEATVSPREALQLVRQALEGLAMAHEAGLIHRDIKPANLLLDSAGSVKVADFGIAKRSLASGAGTGAPTLTEVGTILGTPGYMSPEQVSAEPGLDGRSDIYSIGVVLYELMSARMPYTDEPNLLALLEKIKSPAIAPIPLANVAPSVPSAIATFVHRLLEKDAAKRPPSAAEAVAEIDRLLAGDGGARPSPASRRGVFASAAVMLLVGLVVAWAGWQGGWGKARDTGARRHEGDGSKIAEEPGPASRESKSQPQPPPPPATEQPKDDGRKPEPRPEPDAPKSPALRQILAEYSFKESEKALLSDLRGAFSARHADLHKRVYDAISTDLKRLEGDERQTPLTRRFTAAATEIVSLARTVVDARRRELASARDVTLTLRDGTVVKGAVVASNGDAFTIKTAGNGKESRVPLADLATSDFTQDMRARPALALAIVSGDAVPTLAALIELAVPTEDLLLWMPVAVRCAREDAGALVRRDKFAAGHAAYGSTAAAEPELTPLMAFLAGEFSACRDEVGALELFGANRWAELIPRFPACAVAPAAAARLLASLMDVAKDDILWPEWWSDWELLPKPADERKDLERLDILKDEADVPTIVRLRDWETTSRYVRTAAVDMADQGLVVLWRARWREETSHVALQIESPKDHGALALRLSDSRAVLVDPVSGRELRAAAHKGASSADAWRRLALVPASEHLFVYLDDLLVFHVSLKEAAISRAFALAAQRAELQIRSILVKPAEKK